MIDFQLTSLVYRIKGISMTTVYQILSETEGPGPEPLVQNMVNIGPRPGAPRSQRVNAYENIYKVSSTIFGILL